MPVDKGPRFDTEDIFVDYEFESVMFFWDHLSRIVYRKFYGETFGKAVDPTNALYFEALLHGDEITRERYARGK